MKKIFLLLILLIVAFFGLAIYNFYNPSILLKLFVGSARNIGKPINAEIFINDKKQDEAKLFYVNTNFYNDKKEDYYVLYLRNLRNLKNSENIFPVYVIDKKYNFLEIPNASISDYNIVFGNLYQSESGANVRVPIDGKLKGFGYNPNLKIEKNKFEFEISKSEKFKILIK